MIKFTDLTEADPIVVINMPDYFLVSFDFPAACAGTSYNISYNASAFPGVVYPISLVNQTKVVINTYVIGTFDIYMNLLLTESLFTTVQPIQ